MRSQQTFYYRTTDNAMCSGCGHICTVKQQTPGDNIQMIKREVNCFTMIDSGTIIEQEMRMDPIMVMSTQPGRGSFKTRKDEFGSLI